MLRLNVELLCGIKNEVNFLTVLFLRQEYTSNNFTFFNWQYLHKMIALCKEVY